MFGLLHARQSLTEEIGWTLLHSIWQIAAVALVLRLALALVSPQRASLRYAMSCGALLVSIVCPLVTFQVMEVSSPTLGGDAELPALGDAAVATRLDRSASVIDVGNGAVGEHSRAPFGASAGAADSVRTDGAAGRLLPSSMRDWLEPMLPMLVAGWLIGVLLFACRTLLGEFRARRLCRIDCAPVPSSIDAMARSVAARLSMSRSVRVVQSGLAKVPMAIGWLRPYVLLPVSALAGLSPSELETILLHEFAHIRRRDALVNLIQSAVETSLFYHPAVWWVSNQIRHERENCCDDLVLRHVDGGGKGNYIRALAQLEEARTPALAMSARGGSLLRRVSRMLGREEPHRRRDASLAGGALAAFVVASIYVLVPPEAQSLPAEPTPTVLTTPEQRQANETAYAESREYLQEVHKGRWVVIVDGVVLASFDDLDSALIAADQRNAEATHRFVFRPGVDDGDEDFVQSPWLNTDPSWFQVGRRIRKEFPLTITSDWWMRKGLKHATPKGRGVFGLSIPGNEETAAQVKVRAVCSNMLQQDLTLTGGVAKDLGLSRFSVPGTAWYPGREKIACEKVLCRLSLDDLEIDSVAVGFVIPQDFIDRVAPLPADEWSDDLQDLMEQWPSATKIEPADATNVEEGAESPPVEGEPSVTVEGFVTDSNGNSIKDWRVSIVRDHTGTLDGLDVAPSQVLQATGMFIFDRVPVGDRLRIELRSDRGRRTVQTKPFSLDEVRLHTVVIVVDDTIDPTIATFTPWVKGENAGIDALREVFGGSELIRGEVPATEDLSIAWGPVIEGLRAGIRPPGGGVLRVGDKTHLEVLIRNVGDRLIYFETTAWRQDDDVRLRHANGKVIGVNRILYSGIQVRNRHELRPGEQVELRSGAFGIRRKESFEVPRVVEGDPIVYYSTGIGPGEYDASLSVRLPDAVWFQDEERSAQDARQKFHGVLPAGWARFSVVPSEDG